MPQRSDDLYLVDIVEAGHAVKGFLLGTDPARFRADETLRSAVLWKLYVVAEAASRISIEVRNVGDAEMWGQVRAFRNRMAHGYFTLDPEQIWRIATESLPVLASHAEQLLAHHFSETYRRLMEMLGRTP